MSDEHKCPNCGAFPVERPGRTERQLAKAREVLQRCLTRLKAERHLLSGDDETVVVDPRVHGMDVLIPLLEAALDAGKKEHRPMQPIQQGIDAIIPPRPQVIKGVEDTGKEAGG